MRPGLRVAAKLSVQIFLSQFSFPINESSHFYPFKVIAQLKSTCESLSEEQLAKVGVRLYNCQAQVEGRRTYPCSEEMVRPMLLTTPSVRKNAGSQKSTLYPAVVFLNKCYVRQ